CMSLLLGNGDGTFRFAYAFERSASLITIADFNGDALLDLALVIRPGGCFPTCPPAVVSILLGNGDGTFRAAARFEVIPNALDVVAGDFNGDSIQDLVIADTNAVSVYFGNGDGTFGPAQAIGQAAASIAIGDFNGDHHLDLATLQSTYVPPYAGVS